MTDPSPNDAAAADTVLLCSCEDTMRLDAGTVNAGLAGAGCRVRLVTARHLCRSQLGLFRETARGMRPGLAGKGGRLTVACTQEAPLFREVAEDDAAEYGALPPQLTFVNVREAAGWSTEGDRAATKMAALIAAAQVVSPPPAAVAFESAGVTLIYGRGAVALAAAERLQDRLDITVLLVDADDAVPPSRAQYPVRRGRIRSVAGHLGAFAITIDGFAEPAASSRARYAFGAPRDGLVSKADILIDLTGGPALVGAPELRDGYLRADPGRPLDVERVLAKAADLVGTFDKPRYVTFRAELCAHSRSHKTGCTRCLDLCPAGAIVPAGNHVAIDPHICGGCGACAAACPTGAAAYAVPAADVLIGQLRALLTAYAGAGGAGAVVLVHDAAHGTPLIEACARFGDGLPAHVLPLAVNEVGQLGLETVAAAFAYGAAGMRVLTRAKPRHAIDGLRQTLATANAILAGLGFGADAAAVLATDDPEALAAELRALPLGLAAAQPSRFRALGAKRDVLKLGLRELHRVAPSPVDRVALPAGAMLGGIDVAVAGCTLCLACVAVCPTGALGDAQDRPLLKFDESLCVQCGLCAATCPEKVITLQPRLDFAAFEAGARTIKEEEPFCCTRCAKPFGTRSTIERVIAQLEGKHWMYSGAARSRIDLLRMCEDCRVGVATQAAFDPYAAPQRPAVRTTDDYLRERQAQQAAREAAMLERIEKDEA